MKIVIHSCPTNDGGARMLHWIILILPALLLFASLAAEAAEIPPPVTGVSPSSPPVSVAPMAVAQGHILVRVDSRAAERQFLAAARSLGLSRRGRIYGSNWISVNLPAGADARATARRAAALPGASTATVDLVIRMLDHRVPRDPMYQPPSEVYCDPLLELCIDQWGLFDAGAEGAWHVTLGSADVVVAVLDSGLDLDHDDLYANVWTNPGEVAGNGIDDDGNGIVDDAHGADFAGTAVGAFNDNVASFDGDPDTREGGQWLTDPTATWGIRWDGDHATGDADDNNFDGYPDLGVFHGTAVGGLIAAMTDNLVPGTSDQYEGMAGVCGECTIMPVRMINAEGGGFLSDAVSAINYAVAHGADFINASWGFDIAGLSPTSPEIAPLAAAIDNAVANGVVIVAAAGNSGTPGVHYPATDPRVIAVGSSNRDHLVSWFSSTGPAGEIPDNGIDDDGNGWTDDIVDVVAPGEAIWATWVFAAYDSLLYMLLGDPNWPPGTDTYSAADGTSFAAPLVTGYLALIRSAVPDATSAQLRAVLRSSADDAIGLPGYDPASGFGRLQMIVPGDLPPVVNQSPTADIAGDQAGALTFSDTGKSGIQEVTLDGTPSSDPDGFIQGYSWSWSGSDGSQGLASGASISVTLSVGPVYEFTLIVTDNEGASSAPDVVTVTVAPKSGGGGNGGSGGGPKNRGKPG